MKQYKYSSMEGVCYKILEKLVIARIDVNLKYLAV